MLKKLTLLVMAVAALVAFAVPASASAAEWKFEGKPLAEEVEVELSGGGAFSTAAAGAHGNLSAVVVLGPGSTGTVTSLTVSGCTGTGALNNVPCHGTALNVPWTLHCNSNHTVTITGVELTNTYTGTSVHTILTGNVVVTPTSTGSLDHVTLSGSGTVVDPGSSPATVSGTLEAATPGYSCS